MNILIDLTSLADNFSGIERFALCITKELIKDTSRNDLKYILLFKNEIHKEFREEKSNVQKVVIKGSNKLIFNQITLPIAIGRIRADYYFFPAFPAPFFFFNKKSVSAIHDVGCWDCPSKNKKYMTLYFKLMYWKAALGKKMVVTVSEFSKRRISEILNKNPNEIAVIYDGLSTVFKQFEYDDEKNTRAVSKYNLSKNYLLCLSTVEPRKNMKLLIEAYNQLVKENKIDVDLVLAGRKGWLVDDLMSGLDESVTKKIKFTGFVDEELLPYVYYNAGIFVFPSIYEGFGVPPIEAMSLGIPVISSDAASLPEILGNAAVYFENRNCADLKKKIIEVLNMDKNEMSERKKMGIKRAYSFSWKTEALKLRDEVFK